MERQAIGYGRYVRAGSDLAVCRVDFCTFIAELARQLVVFDPWLSRSARFAPFWRSARGEPTLLRELPVPDVLCISQSSPDHLDVAAIAQLPRDIPIVIHSDAQRIVRHLGFHNVHVLGWGESVSVRTLRVTAIPGRHPRVLDQNGYLLEAQGRALLFLADTARLPELDSALATLPSRPDVLLVSCTGFTLRGYGRIVMSPAEAAGVAAAVAAPDVILMRSLADERVEGVLGRIIVKSSVPRDQGTAEFASALASLAPDIRVHALARGHSWSP